MVQCLASNRCFCRESDRKGTNVHAAEQQNLVHELHGAVQCPNCSRQFHSKRGLTVHTCGPQQPFKSHHSTRSTTRQTSHLVLCSVKFVIDGSDVPVTKDDTNARLRGPYQWNVNMDQSNADTDDSGFGAKEGKQSTDALQHKDRTSTH